MAKRRPFYLTFERTCGTRVSPWVIVQWHRSVSSAARMGEQLADYESIPGDRLRLVQVKEGPKS